MPTITLATKLGDLIIFMSFSVCIGKHIHAHKCKHANTHTYTHMYAHTHTIHTYIQLETIFRHKRSQICRSYYNTLLGFV